MKTSESQKKATKKYDSKTYKKITFRLHKVKDLDILEALENAENKNAYILQQLRKK